MSRKDPFSKVEETLAQAGVIEPKPSEKKKLKVGGLKSELAEQVGLVLGRDPRGLVPGVPKLFLRGDQVMKIEFDPNQGDVDLVPMREAEFVTWVERYITFIKLQGYEDEAGERKNRELKVSLESKVAKLILESPQFRACLPRVTRKNRVRLPQLRKNGKVELLPVGYDEESGVYTFPNDVVIDETWSVSQAVAFFLELLGEFPLPMVSVEVNGTKEIRFCPRGLGAAIGMLLAPFVEGLLPVHTLRCGFIVTANMPRSGKTLLIKIALAPITGQSAGLALSRDEEALRSRIDAALLSGQTNLFFDNVKGYIESHIIEALMTLPTWQGRTFHTQRMFTVKNETTIFISGNNATVSPDIDGRFIFIELVSETADPSTKTHTREIDDRWLLDTKNRGDVLSALYALVRHWDGVGRPGAGKWIPGFRAWCDVIGGIVCAAAGASSGYIGNPLDQPAMPSAGAMESKHMRQLVELLANGGDASELEFEPVEVIQTAMEHGLFNWFMPEMVKGKEVNEVLKQPERVRFGKLMTAKSGEYPRGLKYRVKRGDAEDLWRLSYKGNGHFRKYLLTRCND